MNRSTIDLWVGIFVALGLGTILYLSLKVDNLLRTSHAAGYRIEGLSLADAIEAMRTIG